MVGPTGNRSNLSETLNGTSRSYSWTYDSLYRLTKEAISGGTTGSLTYGYDLVGNRTNRTSTLATLGAQNLSYSANDWLTSDKYDSNGNTTNSSGLAYKYDAENRLTNYSNGQVVMVYDGDGNRVKKVASGVTTLYLVDTHNPTGYSQVLEELTVNGSTTNLSTAYTYGLDLISQRQSTGNIYFFSHDGHKSTRALTDLSGLVVNTFTYDAYGSLIASNGVPQTAYLYCGEQWDSNLGMYYLRARYYKPETGRFWTMDSYDGQNEDPLSLHKYLYCQGNPVNGIDPSGHDDISTIMCNLGIRTWGYAQSIAPLGSTLLRARALPVIIQGVGYLTALGPRALAYLQALGPNAIPTMQRVLLNSNKIVSEAEALEAEGWGSYPRLRDALNAIVNYGSKLNPANIRWHHLVEQSNKSGFAARAINSLANIVPTPTAVHERISAMYSSGVLPGYSRMRDYIGTLSWQEQYRIGLQIWQYAMKTGTVLDPNVVLKIVNNQ